MPDNVGFNRQLNRQPQLLRLVIDYLRLIGAIPQRSPPCVRSVANPEDTISSPLNRFHNELVGRDVFAVDVEKSRVSPREGSDYATAFRAMTSR
jgi:hypothetical protein